MTNFLPVVVDYKISNYRPVVRITGRDEDGKKVIKYVHGFESDFYVKEMEVLGVSDSRIIRIESGPPSLYGDRTAKIVTHIPSEVSGKDSNIFYVKDHFKTLYQSDILFGNKVKIEADINGLISCPDRTFINKTDIKPIKSSKKITLRSQFLDIETLGGSIQDAIKGKSLIPCLTAYDSYLNEYHLFTIIPLNPEKIEIIKQKIKEFFINSLNKLKINLSIEKEEEKIKILNKQISHLEKNLPRILSFKLIATSYPDEPQMFLGYINFCTSTRPDIMAGWNSLRFDNPATINRMKLLRLPYQQLSDFGECFTTQYGEAVVNGVVLMDLMTRYKTMQQSTPSHLTLDYIAKKELGIGKLTIGGHNLYHSDPLTYLAYNVVDVALCVELDKLLHIIDFYVELAILTNSNLDDTERSQFIDNLILSYCKGKYVLPTRSTLETEKIGGAIVYIPEPGLHKNVIIVDFSGMYPSIMKSIGISPENKNPNGEVVAANGTRFNANRMALIPSILLTLEAKRAEFKKLMKEAEKAGDLVLAHEYDLKQYAVKVINNAFYGVLLFKKFRLNDRDCGYAVTSTGKALSLAVKSFIEENHENKIKVVYGDSITKDAMILIKDNNGNIFSEKIENLFKQTEFKDITSEKEYYIPTNLQTLTINKEGEAVWRPIKYIMRHRTNKQIKKVTSGKYLSICVTEDHSLMGYVNNRWINENSLNHLNKRIKEIKPNEIGKKCKSLITIKHIPRERVNKNVLPKELYQFMGLFIGDGSFHSKYGCTNNYLYLSTGDDTNEIIKKVLIPLKSKGYIKHFIVGKNRFDITITGHIVKLLEDFRDETSKIVPSWMYGESEEKLAYFLSGIFESDGCISKQKNSLMIKFSNTNLRVLKTVQNCLLFLGIASHIIKDNADYEKIYFIRGKPIIKRLQGYNLHIRSKTSFKEKIRFITNRKQSILDNSNLNGKKYITNLGYDISGKITVENIDYDDFVYDLEVEDTHTFFANGILCHNTDSLFIEVQEQDITYSQIKETADKLCNEINAFLPKFMKETFNTDKCYCKIEADVPYRSLVMLPKKEISDDETEIQAKKRYAGYRWVGDNKFEFKAKGLEYVKGNTAEITRYVQEHLLKYVLNSAPYEEIATFLKTLYDDFFANKLSIEQIGKPGSLRKLLSEYASDIELKRACEYSNKHLSKEYTLDSSFMLYYLDSGQTDILALDYAEPLPPEYHIDMQKTFDKLVISPTETILRARSMKWDDIIHGVRDNEYSGDLLEAENTIKPLPIFIPLPQPQKIPDIYDFLA